MRGRHITVVPDRIKVSGARARASTNEASTWPRLRFGDSTSRVRRQARRRESALRSPSISRIAASERDCIRGAVRVARRLDTTMNGTAFVLDTNTARLGRGGEAMEEKKQ
jgi:hypothetical protein